LLRNLKHFDAYIVVILLAFLVFSTLLVYSATLDDPIMRIPAWKLITINVVGLVAFVSVALFDYRLLLKIWPYLYVIGISLLIAVFFAPELNGAKGWFKLPGGFNFQPAELMKFILIITVGAWLGKREGERLLFTRDVLPIGALVLFAFIIVMVMPDMGNAMIFLVILIGMYWIGNIKYTHVLIGIVAIVGLCAGAYFLYNGYYDQIHEAVKPVGDKVNKFSHWVKRIDAFFYPGTANKDITWQKDNAMLAIGSGGLTGEGFLNGKVVHSGSIPYTYSDSFFSVVGEEFGFRGSAILLLMYFVLIYRMILAAIQSVQLSGSYIIIGIVSMFVLQIFQNVGMFIGLMPLTGITLPFISYGGTSLLINMIAIGLVMSVRVHQDKPLE
jgi:rod shape determining protein RodA